MNISNTVDLEIMQLLPKWWWFRDSHSVDGSKVRVNGTLVSKATPVSELSILCRAQDAPTSFELTIPSESAKSRFWFLPDTHVSGIQIEYDIDYAADESLVEISTSADDHQRVLPFVQIHDWKTRLPVPPKENIERVSGFGANAYIYFSNGASDFTRFLRTAADHGFDALSENTRVLDWGCGCGRLTRWFADRGTGQYVGVDVDAENIAWCKENIQGADFETIGLYPPTDLERQSFDLVIGNSVLTHLTRETMEKWLAEIRRVLKPDSVALLSFHGDFSNAYLVSRYKDAMLNILDTGCYDKLIGKEMEGVLSDPDYYRQTYFSDDFAVKAFRAAGFEVETVLVGHVSRCQNLAVLRAVHNSG